LPKNSASASSIIAWSFMASPSTARAEAAAGKPPPISFAGWVRVGVRGTLMILTLLPMLLAHALWRLFRVGSPWPRLFLGSVARIAGARVTRHGTHIRRDVVYVSNHISWLDILAIAGQTGSAFVAKSEIETAPVVGWLADLNHTVYVSREDRSGVADQIERLREAIADNWSITIFPEGTTNDGRSLLPFKSSLLKILEPPPEGVVVQPLVLDYGVVGPEISWLGDETGRNNALRLLSRQGTFPLGVHFLEAFRPEDYPGRKAIAAEGRSRIAAGLERVTGATVGEFIGHDHWASGQVAL
jgi:lyso-ornithine lipid O-acyltransferase